MDPTAFAWLVAAAILSACLAVALVLLLIDRFSGELLMQRRLTGLDARIDEPEQYGGLGRLLAVLAIPGRALDRALDADRETPRLIFQAGWRSATARSAYFAAQAAAPVLAILAVLMSTAGTEGRGSLTLLLSIMAGILGLLMPRWLLRSRAAGRRAALQAEVPMLVHVLVLLFEAGLSTRQAIASLVREGRGVLPALEPEFAAVLRQLEAGADTADVLGNLARQLDVSDLGSVLSVLRQAERYGGEIREPLLETLAVIEERRSLSLRERVNLMSGRMTLVMVLFFFPALLIFVAGPAFVSILSALGRVNS